MDYLAALVPAFPSTAKLLILSALSGLALTTTVAGLAAPDPKAVDAN